MSLGPCIPCYVGNHDDCNGPISTMGCTCADHDHKDFPAKEGE